jgi:CRP/FNR family cyclic AMP-dependent transcriptional regulator
MDLKNVLCNVEIFNGLDDSQLEQIAALCTERKLQLGQKIATQGEMNDDLYVVTQGFVEVLVNEGKTEPRSAVPRIPDARIADARIPDARIIVNLGEGQIIGEMALVDQGPRSATVRASAEPTTVQVIGRADFDLLCAQNPHIGYVVMRNIAMDLSFKLRHRNMSLGGL